MARITTFFTLLTVVLWAFGLWLAPPAYNARGWSHEIFYITGVLAWEYMAMALIIAARPAWIERVTGTSLDRLYIHHRRLGWAALVLSFVHYFTKTIFGPVIGLFNLPRPPKMVRGEAADLLTQIWQQLRPIANTSAEWLTWILAVICVLCVIRALRYSTWLKMHKLLSVVFLGLTLHSVRLMDTSDFMTPFGWLNLLITVAGSWAAVVLLVRSAGWQRAFKGVLTDVSVEGNVTKLTVECEPAREVKPGQFVFLGTKAEAPHPFSVVGTDGNRLTLAVRRLGDFTGAMVPLMKPGESVRIEGPWGHFRPILDERRQTWIAAGIGIAPFMAWLDEAARREHGPITLFWLIRDRRNETLFAEVTAKAAAAGVTFKCIESRVTGRAAPETLLADHPERVAVCGSTPLTASLRKLWKGSNEDFMTEVFSWRHRA